MPARIRSRSAGDRLREGGVVESALADRFGDGGEQLAGVAVRAGLEFHLPGAGPGEGCPEPDGAGACAAGELVVDHLAGVAEQQHPAPGRCQELE